MPEIKECVRDAYGRCIDTATEKSSDMGFIYFFIAGVIFFIIYLVGAVIGVPKNIPWWIIPAVIGAAVLVILIIAYVYKSIRSPAAPSIGYGFGGSISNIMNIILIIVVLVVAGFIIYLAWQVIDLIQHPGKAFKWFWEEWRWPW